MTSRMIVYALTFQLLHCLCEGYASHVFPPLLHQRQEDNPWHNLFNAVTQLSYVRFFLEEGILNHESHLFAKQYIAGICLP